MPELAEFYKELSHLEAASKVQLKALLDERQAVLKGLEKVEAELAAAENDGPASVAFLKVGVANAHRIHICLRCWFCKLLCWMGSLTARKRLRKVRASMAGTGQDVGF